MSGLGQRIKEARTARGVTQEDLGRACKVSRAAVAQWEASTEKSSAPTLDKLEPICDLLEVKAEWLLTGRATRDKVSSDVAGSTITIPEYDVRVSAGGGFHIDREKTRELWPFSRRYIADELRLPITKLVVLEVIGDSMEPTLHSGDRVLVNMGDTRVSQPGLFVLWDGDGTVVKRLELIPSTKPQKLRRISDNPLHGTYEVLASETRIIGRVVWYARRL